MGVNMTLPPLYIALEWLDDCSTVLSDVKHKLSKEEANLLSVMLTCVKTCIKEEQREQRRKQ